MFDGDTVVRLFAGTLAASGVFFAMIQPSSRDAWAAPSIILLAAAAAILAPMTSPYLAALGPLVWSARAPLGWIASSAVVSAAVTWWIAGRRLQTATIPAVGSPAAATRPANLTIAFDTKTGRARTAFADGTPAVFIRLKVSNHSGRTARGCRAFLVGVGRPAESGRIIPSNYCEHLPLTWATGSRVPATSIDIANGEHALLDVVCQKQGGTTLVATPGFRQPHSLDAGFFKNTTLSILTLSIGADNMPMQTAAVQARHTGTLYDSAATLLAR